MKSIQDALYNWLTIYVVSEARPDDTAAKETTELFAELLDDEHKLKNIEVTKDEVMYYVSYEKDNEKKQVRFPRELIEVMLDQINLEPDKYENFPIEEE